MTNTTEAKVKEIVHAYLVYKSTKPLTNDEAWFRWIETTQAQELIAGLSEDWISVMDREPKEIDGQILVTNGNGFFEIVWRSDEDGRYNKPHRFDENDWPVFRLGTFTHWQPLPEPPKP